MGRNIKHELVICSGAKECDTHNCKHKFTHYVSHVKEACDKYSCSDMSDYCTECFCVPWNDGRPDQWKYNADAEEHEDQDQYIYTTGEKF